MNLLNSHVLKQSTIRQVEAAGPRVVQVVDRWAGGWPKAVKQLEKQGRLLQEAEKKVEREEPAYLYSQQNPECSLSEALELYDLLLNPPTA